MEVIAMDVIIAIMKAVIVNVAVKRMNRKQ